MTNDHKFLRNIGQPKKSVMASEVASTKTDPLFYSALNVLPNPDVVLRKMGASQDVYDAIMYDPHVLSEVRSLRGGLLKQEWRVMPGADDPASMKMYEICKDVFDRRPARNMSWSDVLWNTFTSVLNGYSVAEIEWQREGDLLVPCTIKDKPQRRFKFNYDHELRLLTKANQFDGEELPDYKFLLSRHMPKHDNPYGMALLSACFWSYTFKHNGMRWWVKYVERFGMPKPIAKYAPGTPHPEQLKLLRSIQSLIEDMAMVIPEGTAVELLQDKISGQAPHQPLVEACNREISKVLTSQTVNSDLNVSGTRSLGETQGQRQGDNSEADSEMVQRTMQTICDWTTQVNSATAVPPTWEWYSESETSKELAETFGTITAFLPVKTDELYKKLQLTPPEPGDLVVFNPVAGAVAPDSDSEQSAFSLPANTHTFKQHLASEQQQLVTDQGVQKSKPAVQRMLDAILDAAETADDLDQFEAALPNVLDDVDTSEFEDAIASARIIANASGAAAVKLNG